MRKLLLSLAMVLMICSSALAQTASVFNSWNTTDYTPFENGGTLSGLSSNGKYATGWGVTTMVGILWEKEGNKLTDIYSTADEDKIDASACGVSDKGTVVGTYVGTTYKDRAGRLCRYPGYRTIDGEWHDVQMLNPVLTGQGNAGAVMCISKDDKVMGGHLLNEDGTKTVPAIWVDGVLNPTVEIADCNIFHMTAMAEDGNIWAGIKLSSNFVTDFTSYQAVMYINGTLVDVPFLEYPANASTYRSYVSSISPNAKFIAGYSYYRVGNDYTTKGFIYNVENASFTWIDGIAPSVVTNDGSLYGRDNIDDILGQLGGTLKIANAVIYRNGVVSDAKTYMTVNYGLNATAKFIMSDITGVSEVSDDAFTMTGYSTKAGGMGNERITTPFVITVDLSSVTNVVGPTSENDNIKVALFDGTSTQSGTFNNFSANGNFIVGGVRDAHAFIFNTETGYVKIVNGPTYVSSISGTTSSSNGAGITNDGVIVGNFVSPDMVAEDGNACSVAGIYQDGAWKALDRINDVPLQPSGFDSFVRSISADGSVIGGAVALGNFRYSAVKWAADGSIAKQLPCSEIGMGSAVMSLSADGNIACGWVGDSQNGFPCIWNGDTYKLFGQETDSYGVFRFVSPNGKYVVGKYCFDPERYSGDGIIYNVETGETTRITGHEGSTGADITGISNDGKVIVGYSMFTSMTDRKPFIIIDGVLHDLDELATTLGYTAPSTYSSFSFFTPLGVSPDGMTIHGMADNGYRLPWVINLKNIPVESKTVYAYVNFNSEDKAGFASFDINNPSEVTIGKTSTFQCNAGAFGNGKYYQVAMDFSGSPWSLDPNYPALYTVDPTTGESTAIANVTVDIFDMTYNYADSKMYALSTPDYDTQTLVTMNLSDGSIASSVGLAAPAWVVGLAANVDGDMYAVATDGNLYSVDTATGATTLIGATGYVPDNSNQSMEFDHDTKTLYWDAITGDGTVSSLVKLNTTTGEATLVGTLAKCENLTGLYIPCKAPVGVISNTVSKANVSVYPTVVTDVLNIKGEYTSLSVYNTAGACVKMDSSKEGSVNLSNLAGGLYFVKVLNGNQSASFKIVKK